MTNNCYKGRSYVQDTDENLAPSGMSSAKAPIQSYDNLPLIQIKNLLWTQTQNIKPISNPNQIQTPIQDLH